MALERLTKLTDNKWLNLYSTFVRNEKTGAKFPYFIATRRKEGELSCQTKDHAKADAVMMVPIMANGDIVFIKQYRPAIDDYIYEMPAGLVDKGETIEQAVKREMFEETGLDVIDMTLLVKPSYNSVGMTDESIAIYVVKVDGTPSIEHNEGNEDIEIVVVKHQDIFRFVDENIVATKATLCAKMAAINTLNYSKEQ